MRKINRPASKKTIAPKSARKASEKKGKPAPEKKGAAAKPEPTAEASKAESRVGQLCKKVGTDKLYRVEQDHGGKKVRVIRVLPDGATKGDQIEITLGKDYQLVSAESAATPAKDGAQAKAPVAKPAKPYEHDPRTPPVGTVIPREYNGRIYEAKVLADGFEYDGKKWRSLTGITREITGISNPNGFDWFGLNPGKSGGRVLDAALVKLALSLLPAEHGELRDLDVEAVLKTEKVKDAALALEGLSKAEEFFKSLTGALRTAGRLVDSRRLAIASK